MTFDKSKLIDLDDCVAGALGLFRRTGLPRLDKGTFRRPLVVGSGNAAVTGRVIFRDRDAVYADEGSYLAKLDRTGDIDGAVLISASGGKHAPGIAQELGRRGVETLLLTHNPDAPARSFVKRVQVFPKQPEPYTYNVSTYLGLILSETGEPPEGILDFLKTIEPRIPANLAEYGAFYLIVPPEFDPVREMFQTKFDELFGPRLTARVFTLEQTKHAKTVVSWERELFIGFGEENTLFGENRLTVPLPGKAGFGTALAAGYFLIGKIQKQFPPYFKDHIEAYVRFVSDVFGQTIRPIVD